MNEHNPTETDVIVEKIEKGEVKVKGARKTRSKATTKSKATQKPKAKKQRPIKGDGCMITDKQIKKWLNKRTEPFTSTEIRDALKFKSRTQARRVLKRLAESGVVKITTTQLTEKRQIYSYTA